MGIDMGLDDPIVMEVLTNAISIIDQIVDRLADECALIEYRDDCEVYRITSALPSGPLSFDRAMYVAAEAARGSLDQISDIIRNNTPTSMIVLHALVRAALVGSCRVVFALLPSDPEVRLQNAKILIAQEGKSFKRALDCYSGFTELSGLRPDAEYLTKVNQQIVSVQEGRRPPGDGEVLNRTAEVVAAALAATPEYQDEHRNILREHFIWLWNTYSGAAHTHAWPRLLPSFGGDRRVPGDYPGDLHMVAALAHIAMLSFKSRLQSGSANTTSSVK